MKNPLSTIFSNGAATLVDAVGSALDKNITSEDEREKNKAVGREITKNMKMRK